MKRPDQKTEKRTLQAGEQPQIAQRRIANRIFESHEGLPGDSLRRGTTEETELTEEEAT
jgi:hypothetical protein